MAFVDDYPFEAKVVRRLLLFALSALAVGGAFGLIQTLHRTGFLRIMESSTYYTVLTVHGVLLVLVFTTFFILGLFTWAIAKDLDGLPSRRLTWGWVALVHVGTLLAAIPMFAGFVEFTDLSADVLFTFYAPMQAHSLFYIGAALLIVGTWVAGFDWIRTWLRWKNANPGDRVPLRTYMVLITMALWYIATLGVAVEVVFFLIPWSLGLIETVDPLLTRTLFWFFGHPVVYFWLMPAYLVWYTVFPKLADGRLLSDPLARLVFVLFLLSSIPVGIHHQYLDPGIAEGYKVVAMSNTMFVLLPSLITFFTVIASIEYGARRRGGTGVFGWLRNLPWDRPAFTGVAFAGLLFAAGGFSGMVNAGMNINYLVHNTAWVPGHFHLTVGTAVALTFMATTYYLLPQLTGKELRWRKLGVWQTALWFVGMVLFSNALHRQGLEGVPRRTAEPQYQGFDYDVATGSMAELDLQVAFGGVILTLSLLLFYAVVIRSLLGARTQIDSEVMPEPLSGAENAPKVLDDFRVWIGISILLILVAYTIPFVSIAADGLLEPGGPAYPMIAWYG